MNSFHTYVMYEIRHPQPSSRFNNEICKDYMTWLHSWRLREHIKYVHFTVLDVDSNCRLTCIYWCGIVRNYYRRIFPILHCPAKNIFKSQPNVSGCTFLNPSRIIVYLWSCYELSLIIMAKSCHLQNTSLSIFVHWKSQWSRDWNVTKAKRATCQYGTNFRTACFMLWSYSCSFGSVMT